MASPGNLHCANCISTLSFPIDQINTLWSTIQELAFYLRRRWLVTKTLTNGGPQDQQQMHPQHQSVNLRPYSISPNLDSDTQWMQIRTHWQIEWPGFVNVVECDVIVVCLRWWCWCDIILPLSISGFASESASKLDSRIRIRALNGLFHRIQPASEMTYTVSSGALNSTPTESNPNQIR